MPPQQQPHPKLPPPDPNPVPPRYRRPGPWLQRIAKLAADGYSDNRISEALNDDIHDALNAGEPMPAGGWWTQGQVKYYRRRDGIKRTRKLEDRFLGFDSIQDCRVVSHRLYAAKHGWGHLLTGNYSPGDVWVYVRDDSGEIVTEEKVETDSNGKEKKTDVPVTRNIRVGVSDTGVDLCPQDVRVLNALLTKGELSVKGLCAVVGVEVRPRRNADGVMTRATVRQRKRRPARHGVDVLAALVAAGLLVARRNPADVRAKLYKLADGITTHSRGMRPDGIELRIRGTAPGMMAMGDGDGGDDENDDMD